MIDGRPGPTEPSGIPHGVHLSRLQFRHAQSPQTLTRVAQQTDVTRDAAYYKANIGKVHTVDDLLNDYRLYHYA